MPDSRRLARKKLSSPKCRQGKKVARRGETHGALRLDGSADARPRDQEALRLQPFRRYRARSRGPPIAQTRLHRSPPPPPRPARRSRPAGPVPRLPAPTFQQATVRVPAWAREHHAGQLPRSTRTTLQHRPPSSNRRSAPAPPHLFPENPRKWVAALQQGSLPWRTPSGVGAGRRRPKLRRSRRRRPLPRRVWHNFRREFEGAPDMHDVPGRYSPEREPAFVGRGDVPRPALGGRRG